MAVLWWMFRFAGVVTENKLQAEQGTLRHQRHHKTETTSRTGYTPVLALSQNTNSLDLAMKIVRHPILPLIMFSFGMLSSCSIIKTWSCFKGRTPSHSSSGYQLRMIYKNKSALHLNWIRVFYYDGSLTNFNKVND